MNGFELHIHQFLLHTPCGRRNKRQLQWAPTLCSYADYISQEHVCVVARWRISHGFVQTAGRDMPRYQNKEAPFLIPSRISDDGRWIRSALGLWGILVRWNKKTLSFATTMLQSLVWESKVRGELQCSQTV